MATTDSLLAYILIVDDTPGSLNLLGEILSEGGYHVRAFAR